MENTNSTSRAVSFLDLPQKLRDRIYHLILESETKPPQRIKDIEEEQKSRRAYAVQPHDISSFGLLYTNRQTRYEMSHAIARQTATEKDITYQLHCLIYHGSVIGTWTALPAPPCHLRHIVVTVHYMQSVSAEQMNKILLCPLLDLVGQFFERNYVWWGKYCEIPLIVDTLTMHLPFTDQKFRDLFFSQLINSGQLWKKVRKVNLEGRDRWVVVPPSINSLGVGFEKADLIKPPKV